MATIQQAGRLNNLTLDTYPTIVRHLLPHATPSTLLALALINRRISEIAFPLLIVGPCLILRNEDDTIDVLQTLLTDTFLGRMVHELHIRCWDFEQ